MAAHIKSTASTRLKFVLPVGFKSLLPRATAPVAFATLSVANHRRCLSSVKSKSQLLSSYIVNPPIIPYPRRLNTRRLCYIISQQQDIPPTKLRFYDDMFNLQSSASLLASIQTEDGRQALVLDSTVFHPQGGGQPSDKGFISTPAFTFVVEDVRSKDKIVYHYGHFENSYDANAVDKGSEVLLRVDEDRRRLNSRIHSAGHLLDISVINVGWDHLEPTKGYHFPDGPYVEYKGSVQQNELQNKLKEIELDANNLITKGGKVSVSTLRYGEALEQCGGFLPDYIPKDSTPRIVQLGESPGCPCGGTHVSNISEILSVQVSQVRSKKGNTKIFYNVGLAS